MDVAECFSEEVPTTHIDLRRRLSTGGRHYEIFAAGTDDDRIALLIVGRDDEGAVLTEVAGEVPPEDLPAVTDLLTTTLAGLVSLSRDPAELRMSAVARKRKRHPNAGARWTADDQARLIQRHHEGASVEELMRELGRNRGGILSRLVQLGELTQEHWPPSLGDTDEGSAGEGEVGEAWADVGEAREGEAGESWAGEVAAGERGLRASRQRERRTRERRAVKGEAVKGEAVKGEAGEGEAGEGEAGEGEAVKGGGREGEAGQRWVGEGEVGEAWVDVGEAEEPWAGEVAAGERGLRASRRRERGTRERGAGQRGAGGGSAGEGGVGGGDADDGALDEGAA